MSLIDKLRNSWRRRDWRKSIAWWPHVSNPLGHLFWGVREEEVRMSETHASLLRIFDKFVKHWNEIFLRCLLTVYFWWGSCNPSLDSATTMREAISLKKYDRLTRLCFITTTFITKNWSKSEPGKNQDHHIPILKKKEFDPPSSLLKF